MTDEDRLSKLQDLVEQQRYLIGAVYKIQIDTKADTVKIIFPSLQRWQMDRLRQRLKQLGVEHIKVEVTTIVENKQRQNDNNRFKKPKNFPNQPSKP